MRTLIHNNRENHAPRTRVGFERLWLSARRNNLRIFPLPENGRRPGMRNYSAATSKSDLTVALARCKDTIESPKASALFASAFP
jgi:hypothetical protein